MLFRSVLKDTDYKKKTLKKKRMNFQKHDNNYNYYGGRSKH